MQKRKPFIFILETGTYSDELIVSIGGSRSELLAFCKRIHVKKPVIDFLSDTKDEPKNTDGFVRNYVDGKSIYLWMRPFDGEWRWFETLIHELHHVVYFNLQKCKDMRDELEALAYQQEYLFRTIRRRVQQEYRRPKSSKSPPITKTK